MTAGRDFERDVGVALCPFPLALGDRHANAGRQRQHEMTAPHHVYRIICPCTRGGHIAACQRNLRHELSHHRLVPGAEVPRDHVGCLLCAATSPSASAAAANTACPNPARIPPSVFETSMAALTEASAALVDLGTREPCPGPPGWRREIRYLARPRPCLPAHRMLQSQPPHLLLGSARIRARYDKTARRIGSRQLERGRVLLPRPGAL